MQLAPAPTPAKTPWYESRKRRLLVTSASQHETFELCNRKWWLKQVRKLFEPSTGSKVFGTVLHGVAERFLVGNDLGYGPDGRPVELYPQGWEVAHDEYNPGQIEGVASPAEQAVIKRLIAAAIENGVLERLPGRRIEHSFRLTLKEMECPTCKSSGRVYQPCACRGFAPGKDPNPGLSDALCECNGEGEFIRTCPTCKGDCKGTNVQITGFIDYLLPKEVQDHKTTKSMKWVKSANKLRENTQMLIYAKIALEEARTRGEPIPEEITLRHNAYCNDPHDLRVRKTEVTVTRREIEDHWNKIIRNGEIMDHIRRNTNAWHEIPDPPTGQNACNAYGGCAYRVICAGQESEQGYEQRTSRHVELNGKGVYNAPASIITPVTLNGVPMNPAQATPAFPPPANYGQPVGGFPPPAPPQQQGQPPRPANVAPAINPPRPAGTVPSAPQGPPPGQQWQPPAPPQQQPQAQGWPTSQQAPQPQMVQALQAQPALPPPPWHVPGCKACSNHGTPGFNSQGTPCRICDDQSGQAGGWVSHMFTLEPGPNGTVRWTGQSQSGPFSGISQMLAPGQPVQSETRQQFTAPVVPQGAEVEETGKGKGGKKAGRPAKSFELYINCVPERGSEERGDRRVFNFDQVLQGIQQMIAQTSGVGHFTQLEPQMRRDALAQQAATIAAGFENAKVFATGIGNEISDANALLSAMIPLAGFVARGVAVR